MPINLTINNSGISVDEGTSVLDVALKNGIYIPHLCSHPDLGCASDEVNQPAKEIYRGGIRINNDNNPENKNPGCQLCLVEVNGQAELQRACATTVQPRMRVNTDNDAIRTARQSNLAKILAEHPHSCLTCAQSQGCSLTQCSSNVPVNERCCPEFNRCEIQKVAKYIGIAPATPRYVYPDIPVLKEEPLLTRNYNLCIGCLRCVRVCRDIRKANSLGFVYAQGKVIVRLLERSELQPTIPGSNSLRSNCQSIVGSIGPTLKESNCHFCGLCVEVCPTGALTDKIPVTNQIACSEGSVRRADCQNACPIELDVPSYIRAIRTGNPAESLEIIRQRTPFPAILGRVCFHPCETKCRRQELNEPISICGLKRYAAEYGQSPKFVPPFGGISLTLNNPQSAIKVAVIGAGPAGLTAAYYLRQSGLDATVFEAEPEPGGMMRYAIPEYRLPLDVLRKEVHLVSQSGVTIKTNMRLGRDFTIESLQKDGFQAVLLAIGAQLPKKIPVLSGISSPNIIWGIDFLKTIRTTNHELLTTKVADKRVLVIGGGNVAVDVALSARRLGAKEITMACLESAATMPAHPWEIDQARAEGINIECSWGPEKIRTKADSLEIDFTRCTAVFDAEGRFNPYFDRCVSKTISADVVIAAIGQATDTSALGNLALTPAKTVKTDDQTLITSIKGVFACGEIAHNPGSVVDAIAQGKKASQGIINYLNIEMHGAEPQMLHINDLRPTLYAVPDFYAQKRVPMPHRSPDDCINDFSRYGGMPLCEHNAQSVETGFTETMSKEEASRCLQCDLRFRLTPVTLPPEAQTCLEFTADNIASLKETEGVYILLDDQKNTIHIKGAMNLRQALQEALGTNKAKYFEYELDPMFTKRESELIQQYLQKYGKLPGGGSSELDDLY
jgi:NADPH-dependent glutamate synthase beta subunit-like oxidoreductase